MANSIVTSNLQSSSTSKFPIGVKNRRLSLILQETKEGTASDWRKNEGLMYAAKEGYINAMKYLVEHGADLRGNQENIFAHAAIGGHVEVIDFILENIPDDDGYRRVLYKRAFDAAVFRGHLKFVQHCVSKQWVDVINYDGNVVAFAVSCGHLDIVKLLVEQGADIEKNDNMALVLATEDGHFNLVQYLLDQGANLHAQDEGALRGALEKGADIRNPKVEKMLATEQGASPERRFLCEMIGYS